MDYEKAYKDALERAKGIHSFSSDIAEIKRMEQIFPELKESKNERVRKSIIHLVKKSQEQGGYALHKDEADKMLIWLEEQGEQKPTLRERYKNIAESEWFRRTHDGMSVSDEESKWTEEDEKCIDNCCLLIGAADDCYDKTFKDDCIHYLQSLKQRMEQ